VVKILSLGRIPARDTSGGRPLEAFERLWHQTALALLQRIKRPDLQQTYLDWLEVRYSIKLKTVPADRPFGRFVLDRAVALEQACWLAQFPVKRETKDGITTTVTVSTPRLAAATSPMELSDLAGSCRTAVTQFDRAAAFADVADEANIRGGVAQFKLGRFDEALAALQRAKADGADAVRDYWGALLTARTLQQLKRLPDAERAYLAAWRLWPDARAPGTGLALVLFELNRRDEAVAASEAVYTVPVASIDPWWAYATADARFIRRWRDTLREMAK
jgi:tetratricopeptide (TPR) repeat protein